jgi:L,D-peptidoglycan transpeptidase YkuD (ErfK/YbiS/YcfS/YnhG family)
MFYFRCEAKDKCRFRNGVAPRLVKNCALMFRQLVTATAMVTVFGWSTLDHAVAAPNLPNLPNLPNSLSAPKSPNSTNVVADGAKRVSVASPAKPKGATSVAATSPSTDPSDPMNAFRVPKDTRQIIVGITETWAANTAKLQRFSRKSGAWTALDSKPLEAVLGPKGLAWGRGLNPIPANAISAAGGAGAKRTKREGDKRSPAGVFSLGKAYGYDSLWAARTKLEYVTVTPADLFIEDTASEFYNTQIRLDHPATSPWELSQQMEQSDPAHRLEVVVGHNTPSPIRGAGSAILLHIWRQNGKKFTTGCTAMADADMETIIRWLDPAARPLYVLLPRSEYQSRQVAWGLPPLGPSTPSTGADSAE